MKSLKLFLKLIVFVLWNNVVLAQDLVQLSRQPYNTVEDVSKSLKQFANYYDQHQDRREIFVLIYQRITDEADQILGTGRFEHDYWIQSLVVSFANEYRKAVYAYESGDNLRVPLPWKFDFSHVKARDLALSTQLVLALNAHILYDLPITLVSIADPRDGLNPFKRDYFKMNAVFKAIVRDMFKIFYKEQNYPSARLNHPAEKIKRKIVFGMIKKMRRTAWKRSMKLLVLNDPKEREAYIKKICAKTMRTNRLMVVLNPILSVGPGQLLPRRHLKAIEEFKFEE